MKSERPDLPLTIARLVRSATPVAPLERPSIRLARWVLTSTALALVSVVIFGAASHGSRAPSQTEQRIIVETEKQIQVIRCQQQKAEAELAKVESARKQFETVAAKWDPITAQMASPTPVSAPAPVPSTTMRCAAIAAAAASSLPAASRKGAMRERSRVITGVRDER